MLQPDVFTIIPSGAAVIHEMADPDPIRVPVKFDAAFLERRMQAHHEMQERMALDLAEGIIREVLALETSECVS